MNMNLDVAVKTVSTKILLSILDQDSCVQVVQDRNYRASKIRAEVPSFGNLVVELSLQYQAMVASLRRTG